MPNRTSIRKIHSSTISCQESKIATRFSGDILGHLHSWLLDLRIDVSMDRFVSYNAIEIAPCHLKTALHLFLLYSITPDTFLQSLNQILGALIEIFFAV